jgi:hypothetical protein
VKKEERTRETDMGTLKNINAKKLKTSNATALMPLPLLHYLAIS